LVRKMVDSIDYTDYCPDYCHPTPTSISIPFW